jgi:hypothetical protein
VFGNSLLLPSDVMIISIVYHEAVFGGYRIMHPIALASMRMHALAYCQDMHTHMLTDKTVYKSNHKEESLRSSRNSL